MVYYCDCCFVADFDSNLNAYNRYLTFSTKQKFMKHILTNKHIKNTECIKVSDDYIECPACNACLTKEGWQNHYENNKSIIDLHNDKPNAVFIKHYGKYLNDINEEILKGNIKCNHYTIGKARYQGFVHWFGAYSEKRRRRR